MKRTVVYTFFLLLSFFACAIYSQTPLPGGPPGACLEGQVDTGNHTIDQYTPVLYSFAPTKYVNVSKEPYLVVMSYNIQSTYSLYCYEVLSNQTELMASINPDLLGLQETDIDVDIRCDCNIPQTVGNALSHTSYFMQMFPWRTGKYGDTTSLGYTVYDLTYVYFNVSNPYFEQRGALAHLIMPEQLNGWKMWYVNSHLEETSLDIRVIQVAQLIDWVQNTLMVQEPQAVVVMTGDFYTVPGDSSYATMVTYFSNAWAVYHGSDADGYTHPSDTPTERFDHIWYKEPAAGNIKVVINNFTVVPSLLSDHRPIYANISFTTSGTPPTPTPPTPSPTAAPTVAPTSVPAVTPTSTPTSAATPAPSSTASSTSASSSSSPTQAPTTDSSSTPAPSSTAGSTGSADSSSSSGGATDGSASSTSSSGSGSSGSGSGSSTSAPTNAPSGSADAPSGSADDGSTQATGGASVLSFSLLAFIPAVLALYC